MKDENYEYLKERILFLGFGDKLNARLETNMKAGKDEFKISAQGDTTKGNKKATVDYTLNFNRSKQSGMYFLNNYDAVLKNDSGEERKQKFYLNNGFGVTAKEAFNLLEGRAVHKKLFDKDQNPYQAWLQLNPTEKDDKGNHPVEKYNERYGFDLRKTLDGLPIKGFNDPVVREDIMKSIEKGNVQIVTFQKNNKEDKMFLEANPKDRSVNVYDSTMKFQSQAKAPAKQIKFEVKEVNGEDAGKKNFSKKELEEQAEGKSRTGRKGLSV